MKKDKTRLILITMVIVTLLATIVLYGFTVVSRGEVNIGTLISLMIPLIIVVFMVFLLLEDIRI